MHEKILVVAILGLSLVVGCAGRAANPVMIHQYGDQNKSCLALERELLFMQDQIQRLVPKTHKTGKNIALGGTGFFFLVPLFFMDLSQAEQIEVDAYRQRYNHLLIVAGDKNCGFAKTDTPTFDQPKKGNADETDETTDPMRR